MVAGIAETQEKILLCYGNVYSYMKNFEANQPMLSHPDKIYPGQMLRIPAKLIFSGFFYIILWGESH